MGDSGLPLRLHGGHGRSSYGVLLYLRVLLSWISTPQLVATFLQNVTVNLERNRSEGCAATELLT